MATETVPWTKRAACHYCHQFISFETALRNWKMVQAPGVADPEP